MISIVIPAYNSEAFLAETLESVQAQTVTDWRLVVVDDASRDGTFALAQTFAARDSRMRVVQKTNGGESAARNFGFAQTDPDSKYVIFLDHDDMWEPDALETLQRALESCPQAIGAYGIGQFVDQDGRPCMTGELEAWCHLRKRVSQGRYVDCQDHDPTTLDTIAYHPSIPTPGVCLLRRAALPNGDIFHPGMRTGSGDIHLWMRLARSGEFLFVDKRLIRGRRHANNMTNNRRLIDQSLVYAYRDVMALPDTTQAQRRILRDGYRRFWRDKSGSQFSAAARSARQGQVSAAAKDFARALRNRCRAVVGP